MHEALPAILILAGLVGFYLAARSAHEVVGGRAPVFAYVLPLAVTVLLAAAWRKPDVALGTALSAALASLALVGGLSLLQRRPSGPAPASAGSWALLVPGALALVIVGLSGSFGPGRAGALLLLALFVLPALNLPALAGDLRSDTDSASDRHSPRPAPDAGSVAAGPGEGGLEAAGASVDAGRASSADSAGGSSGVGAVVAPVSRGRGLTQLALAAAVAGLGGWALIEGTGQLAERKAQATAGLLAAAVLGPATVMPLLGLATSRAADGHTYHALGLCVRFSAAAALVVAPLGALVYLAASSLAAGDPGVWLGGMPFPATLFRVEAVLLAVVGALLLPLASAHLTPRRRDGLLLVGLYTLYLLLSAWSNALAR